MWTDGDDDRNPLDDADHAYEARAAADLKLIAFGFLVLLGLVGCGVVLWIILHIPA